MGEKPWAQEETRTGVTAGQLELLCSLMGLEVKTRQRESETTTTMSAVPAFHAAVNIFSRTGITLDSLGNASTILSLKHEWFDEK